jgi:two-component system chemotaxis response regulator CheB
MSELDRAGDLHATACGGAVPDVRVQLVHFHPEIIVLDMDLHATDPLVMLRKLAAHYPVPVIVTSDARGEHGARTLRALELGAFDVARRPASGRATALAKYARELAVQIRTAAAHARPMPPRMGSAGRAGTFRGSGLDPNRYLVVLGASTGGTEAITAMMREVPADFPPMLIVEHMPPGFTQSFAERLNSLSAVRVTEAQDGERLRAGCAVVARGDTHLEVRPAGDGGWLAKYTHQQLVNRHCPSVDVLFESATPFARQVVGVLLTGMGDDGARGLLSLRRAGALTIAQDEASSVVYGMPKVASSMGAVAHSAAPEKIPELVLGCLKRQGRVAGGVAGGAARA